MNILYRRKKCRLCYKIILLIALISLIIYLFIFQRKNEICSNLKDEKMKYIFYLDYWRILMSEYDIYLKDNKTLWCDVPLKFELISNEICKMYQKSNCKRLPCKMIYSSLNQFKDIKCLNNGQISLNSSDILCKGSYSLDILTKSERYNSYPSIIVDGFIPLSNNLYKNILNKFYRSCDSIWGFIFNFESITHYPWAGNKNSLKLFDISFGYDRSIYDFIPKPWLYNYIEKLKDNSNRLSIKEVIQMKKSLLNISWINHSSYVKSAIVWMNTNCNTPSKRTEYVNQLMKFIQIDNYGNCGNNIIHLPEHIIKIQNSNKKDLKDRGSYNWEQGKLSLSSEYLFTIAIENSINYDYITEKLWHPLICGSVPIYLGAPNIKDWLPCKRNCIIDLTEFKTPKQAAEYIKLVSMNKTLYESYHQWRNEPLNDNFINIINYFQKMDNYSLDCLVCHLSHQVSKGNNIYKIKNQIKQTIGKF